MKTTKPRRKPVTLKKANFETKNDICLLATSDMTNLGEFFSQPDAIKRLKDYFTVTGLSQANPKLIYGQLFGLTNIKTLVAKIDTYNNGLAAADQIAGIRVYDAMSVRPYLPAPDNTSLLADVLLVPVLANGHDYPTVAMLTDPMIVLSDGMPCPNECGTGLYIE